MIRPKAFEASATRVETLARLADIFRRSGLEDPGREARLTLCAASSLTLAELIGSPDQPIGAAAAKVAAFAERRARREPLSRIRGAREFWGMALSISPDVLDPRPETETLVETALTLLRQRRTDELRILDLGVGSGALICALLREFPCATGIGVDISFAAAEVARANVEACGLIDRAEIRLGDWTAGVEAAFDLIVSNPPYIRSADIDTLAPEVRDYDPRLALDGGGDGLRAYRAILPACAALLAPKGWLLVELGGGLEAELLAMAADAGFRHCTIKPDIAGLARVLAAGGA